MNYVFTRTGPEIEAIHGTVDNIYNTLGNANLLSNPNFLVASPDDITHPSSTPTDYTAGAQIFSNVFVSTDIVGLTLINGRLDWVSGSFYTPVYNSRSLEYVTEFTASVADFDGIPRTRGVSFSLVGDEYRVTVDVDALEDAGGNATPLGSVKFEQGSVATRHESQKRKSVPHFRTLNNAVNGIPNIGSYVNWSSLVGSVVETSYFSLESMTGSAKYIVKTAAQVAADGDVIDGDGDTFGVNHQIDTDYFLILLPGDNGLLATQCGASPLLSDNSVQLQAWMDFEAITRKHLPFGDYLSGNLTIPNRFQSFTGDGRYASTIKSISSPANSDYLVASSSYVTNSSFGNDPISWSGLRVWSDGSCDNAFVWYGYGSEFDKSYFWSQGTGDSLRITSSGISGSQSSTTLVENSVTNCILRSNFSNTCYALRDPGNKLTDMIFTENILRDGEVFIQTTAGANISGNHFYGSSDIDIRGMATGTVISKNYFENEVEFNNFLSDSIDIGPGNQFGGRVTYSFGGSGEKVFSKSNRYYGVSADAYHNFFGSDKILFSIGDTFATSIPFVFSNPGSPGRITASQGNSGATPDGALLEGSRTGSTGAIVNVWWNSSDPTSGSWTRGDIIYNSSPVAGGKSGRRCTTSGVAGSTAVFKEFGQIDA